MTAYHGLAQDAL